MAGNIDGVDEARPLGVFPVGRDPRADAAWANYLDTDAGREYTRWEQQAASTVATHERYDAAWERAWLDELGRVEPPLPEQPATRPVRAWPVWAAAHAALATIWLLWWASLATDGPPAMMTLPTLHGLETHAVTSLWGAALLMTLVWCQFPITLLAAHLVWRAHARARWEVHARCAQILDRRARERTDRYGVPVTAETFGGGPSAVVVDRWAAPPRELRELVELFRRGARVVLPRPEHLPWRLTVLDPPRPSDPRFPEAVDELLTAMARDRAASS